MNGTTLIVIRHGETHWNIEGKWQGHEDSPLTDNGVNQAKAVARQLQRYKIDALYSSDLGRAMQTAEIIAKPHQLKIQPDPRIRERHLGNFQGLTLKEMKSQYPHEYLKHTSRDANYKAPGGESKEQQYKRSIHFFSEIVGKHPNQTIVIITHGGVVDCLFKHVMGLPLDKPRSYILFNTAINIFSCEKDDWKLLTFGDISHLNQLKTLDEKVE